MPYIKENHRSDLDNCIDIMTKSIKGDILRSNTQNKEISNQELLNLSGDINYCFSRVLGGIMGEITYPKIAVITGVLENIKQEFYRRIASPYEDLKILQNGDIKEYKGLN